MQAEDSLRSDNQRVSSVKDTLLEWYLARLRSEAVALSQRFKLTPLAQIESDKDLVAKAIAEDLTGQQPNVQTNTAILVVALPVAILGSMAIEGSRALGFGHPLLSFASLCGIQLIIVVAVATWAKHSEWKRQQEISTRAMAVRERIIAEHAAPVLLAIDVESNVLFANLAVARCLEYLPEELMHKPLTAVLASPAKPDFLRVLHENRMRATFQVEISLVGKAQHLRHFDAHCEWSTRQNVFFCELTDITDARVLQTARSQFIARITHDVKTPLQGLYFSLECFKGGAYGELSDQATKSVNRMESNITDVLELLGELIDFEQASEKIALDKSPVDIRSVVESAISHVEDLASKSKLSIHNVVENGIIELDQKRISRVLINLLANAIKFSPPNNTVEISSRRLDEAIELCVSDSGPGIPQNLSLAIFDPYFQLPSNQGEFAHALQHGSGLGLAICKAIVTAHGGLIGVRSQPEERVGSVFWITLPIA
jgi:signal transduction histidine kinase